ncbi:MAG: hypothetical protein Q8P67_05260, partial [archaeon]|nr:hypothetical protein [archaeon]
MPTSLIGLAKKPKRNIVPFSTMTTKEAPLGAVKRQTLADVAEKRGVDIKDVNKERHQFQYKHEDLRCRYGIQSFIIFFLSFFFSPL